MQREAKGAEKEKIKELLKKNKGLTARIAQCRVVQVSRETCCKLPSI